MIRLELKEKFPNTKFSVRSQTYSGGDSVDVAYTMTLDAPKRSEVEAIVFSYQGGRFDGMTDCYDHDSSKTWMTVKYAFVNVDYDQIMGDNKEAFLKYWGLVAYDDTEIMKKLGCWKQQALLKYVRKHVLQEEA